MSYTRGVLPKPTANAPKSHIQEVLEVLRTALNESTEGTMFNANWIVAGSFVLTVLGQFKIIPRILVEYRDIDVYCLDEDTWDSISGHLQKSQSDLEDCDSYLEPVIPQPADIEAKTQKDEALCTLYKQMRCGFFDVPGLESPINLVFPSIGDTEIIPHEVISRFDFTQCSAAIGYDAHLDSWWYLVHNDILEGEGVLKPLNISNPIKTLQRMFKYGDRGYIMSSELICSIFGAWDNLDEAAKVRLYSFMQRSEALRRIDWKRQDTEAIVNAWKELPKADTMFPATPQEKPIDVGYFS